MARTFCLEWYWNRAFELTTGSVSQNNFEDRDYLMAGKTYAIFMCGDDGRELKGSASYGAKLKILVSKTS